MLAAAMVFGLAQAPALSVTALAATKNEDKDYTVTDAWWSDDFGSATAEWEKAEDSTKYKVKLYKGTSTKVLKDVSTSSDHYDFSSIVSQKGTGKYYFTVTPVKGTADDGATSDILEVDSDTMSDIKAYLKDKKKEATSGSGSGSGSAAGPGAAA